MTKHAASVEDNLQRKIEDKEGYYMATEKCRDASETQIWAYIWHLQESLGLTRVFGYRHHVSDAWLRCNMFSYYLASVESRNRRTCAAIGGDKNHHPIFTIKFKLYNQSSKAKRRRRRRSKRNLRRDLLATTSAWESLRMSPRGLSSDRLTHLVPVPNAITSTSAPTITPLIYSNVS